jgi:hypothetical protein
MKINCTNKKGCGCKNCLVNAQLGGTCVFYTGSNLIESGIVTNDNLNTTIFKLNEILRRQGTIYTDKNAQDAVGNILLDSPSIDFTYNGFVPYITANVNDSYLVSFISPYLALKEDLANKVVDLSNPNNTTYPTTQAVQNAIDSATIAMSDDLYKHLNDFNNPHKVTKAQIGLGNVDNTSDLNKPISTATQTALNLKEDKVNKAFDFLIQDNVKFPTTLAVVNYVTSNFAPITGGGYVPTARKITINSVQQDLTADRVWSVGEIKFADNYSAGELFGTYQAPQLNNNAVISKILTGLSQQAGSISASDSILIAFGKAQYQINNIASTLTGYVPTTRTITINGTTYDLSSNRTWNVGDILSTGSYANPSWITALDWAKITNRPTTLAGYGITDAEYVVNKVTNLTSPNNTTYPTTLAVSNALANYAPITGSGNYIQNQIATAQTAAFNIANDSYINGIRIGLGGGNIVGNVIISNTALQSNSAGGGNTGVGYNVMQNNTAGTNTAFGAYAMATNSTGTQNVAVGYSALLTNSTGSNNTAVGMSSQQTATGGSNTSVGVNSLYNVTGGNNTGLGLNVARNLAGGSHNTVIGSDALNSNVGGQNNVVIGSQALRDGTSGGHNIVIGYASAYAATGCNYAVAVGEFVTLTNNSSNEIAIGYNAVGNGTNTVTLGNVSTGLTYLKGRVLLGATDNGTDILQASGSGLFTTKLRLGSAITSDATVLDLGSSYSTSPGANMKLLMYPGYGFGIGASVMEYVAPSNHKFYGNGIIVPYTTSDASGNHGSIFFRTDLSKYRGAYVGIYKTFAMEDWVDANYAPVSTSANYIQNQNAAAQTANSWITGTHIANTQIKTAVSEPNTMVLDYGASYKHNYLNRPSKTASGIGSMQLVLPAVHWMRSHYYLKIQIQKSNGQQYWVGELDFFACNGYAYGGSGNRMESKGTFPFDISWTIYDGSNYTESIVFGDATSDLSGYTFEVLECIVSVEGTYAMATPSWVFTANNFPVPAGAIQSIKSKFVTTVPQIVTGRTIYVDKDCVNATDTRTGISPYSIGQPFKTITGACKGAATNDTIMVMPSPTAYTETVVLDPLGYGGWMGGTLFLNHVTLTGDIGAQNTNWGTLSIYGSGNATIDGKIQSAYAFALGNLSNLTITKGWSGGYTSETSIIKDCKITFTVVAALNGIFDRCNFTFNSGWNNYVVRYAKYTNCDLTFTTNITSSYGGFMGADNAKCIFENSRITVNGIFFDDCRYQNCLLAFRNSKVTFGNYIGGVLMTYATKVVSHNTQFISTNTSSGRVFNLSGSGHYIEWLNSVRNVPLGITANVLANDINVSSITDF